MSNNTSTSLHGDEKLPGAKKTTWTKTQFKVFEFCHKWTIEKFSYLQMKPGEKLESSVFAAEGHDAEKWQLGLFPFGETEAGKTGLSLFLYHISNSEAINAKYVLSLIDTSGNLTHEAELAHTFPGLSSYGRPHFMGRAFLEQNKDKFLSGDKLVILCKGSYTCDSSIVSGITETVQFPVPTSKMHDDFGSLLGTQQFSDVILDVCGTQFHAHKAILSARSTVFAAMFNNEMQELKENRAVITDTDPEVFEELLKFIYSDKAPKLKDIAAELICVADKYAVLRLKKLCAAALFESLSVYNALDTLILADLHNAEELKKLTLVFISSHAQAVMNPDSYKSMFKTHPQLIAEALATAFLQQAGKGDEAKSQSPQ